ncbi:MULTISPECIES: hypothetical protein [Nitrosomonas]|nr:MULTISPECIES: hypothetical protein [Nitrosomonas]
MEHDLSFRRILCNNKTDRNFLSAISLSTVIISGESQQNLEWLLMVYE